MTTVVTPPITHNSGHVQAAAHWTYHDLKTLHLDALRARLLESGTSLNSVNNHATAINQWLERAVWLKRENTTDEPHVSASLSDRIGDEFGTDFELRLNEHLLELEREGKAPSTIHTRKHLLCEWQKSWFNLLKTLSLPQTFSEALKALQKLNAVGCRRLARACNSDPALIKAWTSGKHLPCRRSIKKVAMLEEFLCVQPGSLVSRLPIVLVGDMHQRRNCNGTPYRVHLSEMHKKPYTQPYNSFTSEQQGEWKELLRFYTDSAWVAGRGLNRHERGWRTRENNGKNSTAEIKLRHIQDFYGFLILPSEPDDPAMRGIEFDPDDDSHKGVRGFDPHLKGLGFDPKTLSLALVAEFTNVNLVAEWVAFLKGRSFGKRNNNRVKLVLNFCAQLLRPDYGFLWQQHKFGRKLSEPILTQEEWRARCSEAYRRIRNILSNLEKSGDMMERFVETRDTSLEVVVPLIKSREHPITVMSDIVDALRYDFERTTKPISKAILFRNMVMVELVTSNPVRAINIAEMRYKVGSNGYESDRTNLYKLRDGFYRLKYEVPELKNGITMGRYDLPVIELWKQDLDEYFDVWRPLLLGAEQCDYVFRPHPVGKHSHIQQREDHQILPMHESALSDIMRTVSSDYIPNCPGFGLHSARHFAATEWLKHHPGAYNIASVILHDTPQTVEDAYSWVTPNDKIAFWDKHLTTLIQPFLRGEQ